MDTDQIIQARTQAEAAVRDMRDPDLRAKAFEVILRRLLEVSSPEKIDATAKPKSSASREGRIHSGNSIPGRILALKEEGFFQDQRSISDIRNELRNHGWHIPLTTLSGRLQGLVQQRRLRRERVNKDAKRIWMYSTP